jgi:PAS domain S-box-containing protein
MTPNTHRIDLVEFINTTNRINKAKSFLDISEIIFDFIKKLFQYDLAVFYSVNNLSNQLEVVSCRGADFHKLKNRSKFSIGEGSVGWVAKSQKALLIEDVLDYEDDDITVRLFDEDPQIRSFLAVPLIIENKTIGVLSVSSSESSSYNEGDVEMINVLVAQAAVLFELNKKFSAVEMFSNLVLENIDSAVVAIDKYRKIIGYNKKAVEITGYARKDMINKDIVKLKIIYKKNSSDSKYDFLIKEKFSEEPGLVINAKGEKISVVLGSTILFDSEGHYNGNIIIFRDNTFVELLQKQILQSEKRAVIGRMTSGILHEIRNPLLPIRSSAQMLLAKIEKDGFDENYSRLIRIIYEESERLNRFLETLEGFKDRGKQSFVSPLIDTLNDILIICDQDLKKKNISIKLYNAVGHEMYIPFSTDQLKQILLNIIINAIDAIMEKEGYNPRMITISIEELSGFLKIKVSDTGIGIKEDEKNIIFDPFYTTKTRGTGLGLSIVSQMISDHNGVIDISNNENGGATVELMLPVIQRGE